MRGCLVGEVVAIAKADLESDGGCPTKGCIEVEQGGIEVNAIPGPQMLQRSLLCLRDPASAHHKRADGTGMFDLSHVRSKEPGSLSD
jgi:hypothetical protein